MGRAPRRAAAGRHPGRARLPRSDRRRTAASCPCASTTSPGPSARSRRCRTTTGGCSPPVAGSPTCRRTARWRPARRGGTGGNPDERRRLRSRRGGSGPAPSPTISVREGGAVPARSRRADRGGARRPDDLQRASAGAPTAARCTWPTAAPGRPRVRLRRRARRDLRRRVLITVPDEAGVPDGLTVDAAGDLWVAICGGGRVHRYSPDGRLRRRSHVPGRGDHVVRVRRPRPAPALRHHGHRGLERRAAPRRARRRAASTGSTPTRRAGRRSRSAPTRVVALARVRRGDR